jgi:hypothetical protein
MDNIHCCNAYKAQLVAEKFGLAIKAAVVSVVLAILIFFVTTHTPFLKPSAINGYIHLTNAIIATVCSLVTIRRLQKV